MKTHVGLQIWIHDFHVFHKFHATVNYTLIQFTTFTVYLILVVDVGETLFKRFNSVDLPVRMNPFVNSHS